MGSGGTGGPVLGHPFPGRCPCAAHSSHPASFGSSYAEPESPQIASLGPFCSAALSAAPWEAYGRQQDTEQPLQAEGLRKQRVRLLNRSGTAPSSPVPAPRVPTSVCFLLCPHRSRPRQQPTAESPPATPPVTPSLWLPSRPRLPHLAPEAGLQHGALSPDGTPSSLSWCPCHHVLCTRCRALLGESRARKGEPKGLLIPALQAGTFCLEGPRKPCQVPPVRSRAAAPPAALVGQQRGLFVLSSFQKSLSSHFWLSARLGR